MLIWCLACVPVFIASYAGTSGLRRYALARQLLDVPNARSSHSQPTPVAVVWRSFWLTCLRWWGYWLQAL